MFMLKKKVEEKNLLHIPQISEKIVVEKKEDYFDYIKKLKREKETKSIHFISKENTRFFMSNPNKNNVNIINGYEYLYLKNKIAFQEIMIKHLKNKKINNPVLESFVIFFTEQMYKIIEVKYYNTEEISLKEIINIHLNYLKEMEEYNKFMKDKIKDSVKYHISGLFYELGFKEILENLKREIVNIDHGLINLKNILDLRSIDVYETCEDYNSILSNVIFQERLEINKNKKIKRQFIIFDEIPNNIFKSPHIQISQFRSMGVFVIFPYFEGEEIEEGLNVNTKMHILKK